MTPCRSRTKQRVRSQIPYWHDRRGISRSASPLLGKIGEQRKVQAAVAGKGGMAPERRPTETPSHSALCLWTPKNLVVHRP